MIDKSGEYWHLHFDKQCYNYPTQILALVRELFSEIAEMGDVHFVRVKPEIEVHQVFDDIDFVTVRCRLSAKPTTSRIGERIVAIGGEPLDQSKFCDKCGAELGRGPPE